MSGTDECRIPGVVMESGFQFRPAPPSLLSTAALRRVLEVMDDSLSKVRYVANERADR